jgi:hypothetical protein
MCPSHNHTKSYDIVDVSRTQARQLEYAMYLSQLVGRRAVFKRDLEYGTVELRHRLAAGRAAAVGKIPAACL